MTRPAWRAVVVPFAIFTLIWGSTWIVIRDQLGTVPAQWSVSYRFLLAAAAMFAVAKWNGDRLAPSRPLLGAAAIGLAPGGTVRDTITILAEAIEKDRRA